MGCAGSRPERRPSFEAIGAEHRDARGLTSPTARLPTNLRGSANRRSVRRPVENNNILVATPIASPGIANSATHRDFSVLSADEAASALGADLVAGLTSQEASRRLAQHGPNELRSVPRRPGWLRATAHFHDPLTHLLLAAIAVALVAWTIEGRFGWPIDAIVIATVVLLNGILGFVQEAKAQDAVAALVCMTTATSAVMRDGRVRRLPSAELVRGDLLVLGEGDSVGADARLVRSTSLRVQEASLTGESEAVMKDATTLAATAALGDRLDMVFKGTAVAQGIGHAVVTATGMATEMGHVATMLHATVEEPTPLEKEIGRIGRMLGLAVVVISIVVVATILLMSSVRGVADVTRVLLLGVALAVAVVPEGLPAILSLVLALGVRRMAKHHAIVKKLASVETLGSASVIASDKTGTLTRAEMTIERVMTASGETRITGVGYAPEGRMESEGAALLDGPLRDENVVVLSGGSLAGNADLRRGAGGELEIHGDPTEAAFLVAERKLGVNERRVRRFERIGEIPFTSERKMMSTIELDHEHDDEVVVITKGAPASCSNAETGRAWAWRSSISTTRCGCECWPMSTRLPTRRFVPWPLPTALWRPGEDRKAKESPLQNRCSPHRS